MRARLLVVALLGLLALLAPAAADARAKSAARGDGTVTVDVKIKRFALMGQRVVARGVLTSRVEGAGESQAARKRGHLGGGRSTRPLSRPDAQLDDFQLDLLG